MQWTIKTGKSTNPVAVTSFVCTEAPFVFSLIALYQVNVVIIIIVDSFQ